MANKMTISIPKELKKKLEEKIKQTNFKSIQDYIIYILNQIVSDNESDTKPGRKQAYTKKEEADIRGPHAYTEEDEEALKKNLEDLGYL